MLKFDIEKQTGLMRAGTIHTPHGDVVSEWKRKDGHFEFRFTLPKGVSYDINIADCKPDDIVTIKRK